MVALLAGTFADRKVHGTGDAAFPGGVGKSQKDAEHFRSLYDGVVEKIFNRLPDQTWVYPGHGNDTTLGAERPHPEEWRARGCGLDMRSP